MNGTLVPTQSEYTVMARQAKHLVESGLLPQAINTPQKAIAIITLGRELDIPAWQAINGIHVIQGKPTVSPQLMLALIERSGKLEDIKIDACDDACVVTMKRAGRSPHTVTFNVLDAQRMGLLSKDNWKKQPKTMLQWRAISACARVIFPDVICGLYLSEEINPNLNISEEGEIVDAESREVEKTPVSAPQLPAPIPEPQETIIEPTPEPEKAPVVEGIPKDQPGLVIPPDAISQVRWKDPWMHLSSKNYNQQEAESILRKLYSKLQMEDGTPKESTKKLTEKELEWVMSALNQYPLKSKKESIRKMKLKAETMTLEQAIDEVTKTGKISLRAKVLLRGAVETQLPPEASKNLLEIINDSTKLNQEFYLDIARGLNGRKA